MVAITHVCHSHAPPRARTQHTCHSQYSFENGNYLVLAVTELIPSGEILTALTTLEITDSTRTMHIPVIFLSVISLLNSRKTLREKMQDEAFSIHLSKLSQVVQLGPTSKVTSDPYRLNQGDDRAV